MLCRYNLPVVTVGHVTHSYLDHFLQVMTQIWVKQKSEGPEFVILSNVTFNMNNVSDCSIRDYWSNNNLDNIMQPKVLQFKINNGKLNIITV